MSSPVAAAVSTAVDTSTAMAAINGTAASGLPIDFAALLLSAQGATSGLPTDDAAAMLDEGAEDGDSTLATGDPAMLLAVFFPHIAATTGTAYAGGGNLADGNNPSQPSAGMVALDLSAAAGTLPQADKDLTAILTAGDASAAAKFADASAADLVPGGTDVPAFDHLLTHNLVSGSAPTAPATTTAAAPQAGMTHVSTPLQAAGWGDDFGQRLVWMARNDVQTAQLSINPGHLGPIEVTLNLGSDQATAVFSSPFSDVRESLEAALPRLREMLAGAGIELGQAQVSAQSRGEQNASGQNGAAAGDGAGSAILRAETAVNVHSAPLRMHRGLIDTFA